MRLLRGEIYYVYLDPVFGREMGGYKVRPVVVVSANDINDKPLVVTVAPGTTTRRIAANVVAVRPSRVNGLSEETFFHCEQLRALDKGRFTSRPVGRLEQNDLDKLRRAIEVSLSIT